MAQWQEPEAGLSLIEVLGRLPDPRSVHGRRHRLRDLGMAVSTMLCGARKSVRHPPMGSGLGSESVRGSGVHSGADAVRVHATSGVQQIGLQGLRSECR